MNRTMEKNDEKKNLAGVDTGCACGKCASECKQERTEKKEAVDEEASRLLKKVKKAHLNIDDLRMIYNIVALQLDGREEKWKKMLAEPKGKKSSKTYNVEMLRDFLRLTDKLIVPELQKFQEISDDRFRELYDMLELLIALVCDMYELQGVNPLNKCESLRQYLVYNRLGMVSDVKGYKVLKGRLINEFGEDVTDEKYFNGKAEGVTLGSLQNEEFDNEFENN